MWWLLGPYTEDGSVSTVDLCNDLSVLSFTRAHMEFTNSHSEVNVISDYHPHLRLWIFFFLRVKFLLRNYSQTFSPFFLKLIISMPKETENFPKFTVLFASLRKPKMFSCKEEWPDIAKNSLKPKCLNISFFFPWSLRVHIPRCMPSCDIYMFFFSFHLLLFIRILLQKDCYCILLYLCSGKGNSFYYCTYFPILKILINLSSNLPFSLSSFPSFFPSYFTFFFFLWHQHNWNFSLIYFLPFTPFFSYSMLPLCILCSLGSLHQPTCFYNSDYNTFGPPTLTFI